MTAVVGFSAVGGTVICADRQFTKEGGLKFQDSKIVWQILGKPRIELVFGYSGNRDAAATVFDSIADSVFKAGEKGSGSTDPIIYYQKALEKAFKVREAGQLESLIAIQASGESLLYRSHAHKVVRGRNEFIGVGDSSVLRYWADITSPRSWRLDEVQALGIYLISLANRYIDGCGFGVDVAIIPPDAEMKILGKQETAKYAPYFSEFEKSTAKNFFDVCARRVARPSIS